IRLTSLGVKMKSMAGFVLSCSFSALIQSFLLTIEWLCDTYKPMPAGAFYPFFRFILKNGKVGAFFAGIFFDMRRN
ncbi:MAG: hypothetical protein RR581_09685, partial [Eubacterium sp.]